MKRTDLNDVVVDLAPLSDGHHDGAEVVVRQDDVRGLFVSCFGTVIDGALTHTFQNTSPKHLSTTTPYTPAA